MSAAPDPTNINSLARIACFSPWLRPLIGTRRPIAAEEVVFRPKSARATSLSAVVGATSIDRHDMGFAYAKKHSLTYLDVSLGLYPSARSGKRARPWSVVIAPFERPESTTAAQKILSLLLPPHSNEETTESCSAISAELLARAEHLRSFIVEKGLTSSLDGIVDPGEVAATAIARPVAILVASECHGDERCPCQRCTALIELVDAAARENKNAPLWLLREIAPLTGRVSAIPQAVLAHPQVRLLPLDVDCARVFELVRTVYTYCSHLGFEALLRDVPVSVFGSPFYAGFGLTSDRLDGITRPTPRSREEILAAALLLAPRYYDPVTEVETTAESAFSFLALQRRRYLENRGEYTCVGFSLWKRAIVTSYLTSPDNQVRFVRDGAALAKARPKAGSHLVVWASKPHDDIVDYAERHQQTLVRVEDGFLRSVGLGSDWAAPGSLVFDSFGIYYDPRQPSKLERILQTGDFSDEELAQAETLRQLIVSLRLSKYNIHREREYRPNQRNGQHVVLVPGQVADDASVRFGGSAIGGITELLRAVRQMEPEAHILYKPHPDVVSGNRKGHLDEGLGTWFDELVVDVPIAACLEHANSVHTISSLVGFEALLRGLPVTCHGQPFYAGWGLTRDIHPIARRTRRLTLQMLIAGVLGRYPRYYHFPTGTFCTEAQMASVISTQKQTQTRQVYGSKSLRKLNSLLQLARDISHAR